MLSESNTHIWDDLKFTYMLFKSSPVLIKSIHFFNKKMPWDLIHFLANLSPLIHAVNLFILGSIKAIQLSSWKSKTLDSLKRLLGIARSSNFLLAVAETSNRVMGTLSARTGVPVHCTFLHLYIILALALWFISWTRQYQNFS